MLVTHVSENDPRLEVADIKYPSEKGEIIAHFAKPKGAAKRGGVIVIHEIWGLVPHIKEVARRFALEGYLVIAPDALSPFGGTPENSDERRPLMQKLDPQDNLKNYLAAVKYLKTHPDSNGKVGVTGFCWGGGITNQVAVSSQDVQAAAPFYGRQAPAEDVPKIKAAMLIHYASDDARINEGIPAFEAALKQSKIEYKIHMYEGAKHAFFNDTGQQYNEAAAKLAWERTLEFFKKKLT
ncbi:dienelactone hydrolase family protein [Candidatus Bathyarchaeota archaeon]|nr:dienelactone hydrolase family protein [Candidatus Bathyarchaeota archaeon]